MKDKAVSADASGLLEILKKLLRREFICQTKYLIYMKIGIFCKIIPDVYNVYNVLKKETKYQ